MPLIIRDIDPTDSTTQVFACKTIRFDPRENHKDAAERECLILSRLDHPNIVKYLDIIWAPTTAKIYMDYCAGGSLADFIRGRSSTLLVSEAYVLAVFRQLCAAIFYCHNGLKIAPDGTFAGNVIDWEPVLHRDIKPGNVMLSTAEETADVVVQLGDFGLSTFVDDDKAPSTYAGTKEYLAPEINRSKPDGNFWTKSCDIFSLGCTMYELASLEAPFGYHMDDDDQNTVQPLPKTYSDKLTGAILACIHYEPNRRPDIISLLRRIRWRVNGVTPTETPTSLKPLFSPPPRTNPENSSGTYFLKPTEVPSSLKPSLSHPPQFIPKSPLRSHNYPPPDPEPTWNDVSPASSISRHTPTPPLDFSQSQVSASHVTEPESLTRWLSEIDMGPEPNRRVPLSSAKLGLPLMSTPPIDADPNASRTSITAVCQPARAPTLVDPISAASSRFQNMKLSKPSKNEKKRSSVLDIFRRKEKEIKKPVKSSQHSPDSHTRGNQFVSSSARNTQPKHTRGNQFVASRGVVGAQRKFAPPPRPRSPKLSLTINTLIGTKIHVRLEASATVFDLKQAINDKEGIPVDQQRIIALDKQLEDNYHLSEYGINEDTSIYLVLRLPLTENSRHDGPFQIYVQTLTGKTVAVTTNRFQTVFQVKRYIEAELGCPPEAQRLFFTGTELEDDVKLVSCNITPEAKLHLVLRVPEYDIFIKTLTGRTIKVRCHPTDTVSKIKDEVYLQDNIEQGKQRLIHKGKQLEDHMALRDCGIENFSTLHLILRL